MRGQAKQQQEKAHNKHKGRSKKEENEAQMADGSRFYQQNKKPKKQICYKDKRPRCCCCCYCYRE
jgi:hypothetical protein